MSLGFSSSVATYLPSHATLYCNSLRPILQIFTILFSMFLTCFQISLLLKVSSSSLWFSQTYFGVSFSSLIAQVPSLSCSWKAQ